MRIATRTSVPESKTALTLQYSFIVLLVLYGMVIMNQWTVPLEWNTGMEYSNDLNCYKWQKLEHTYSLVRVATQLVKAFFLEFYEVKGHMYI